MPVSSVSMYWVKVLNSAIISYIGLVKNASRFNLRMLIFQNFPGGRGACPQTSLEKEHASHALECALHTVHRSSCIHNSYTLSSPNFSYLPLPLLSCATHRHRKLFFVGGEGALETGLCTLSWKTKRSSLHNANCYISLSLFTYFIDHKLLPCFFDNSVCWYSPDTVITK